MKTEEKSNKVMSNKLSEKLGRIVALSVVGIACVVAGYVGGVHYAENSVTDNQANNPITLNTTETNALSVSDPLLLVKLTTQCPQLPPELLEMALMFVETPEQRAAAARLTDSPRYKSSTGPDWIKQAPNPFAKEREEALKGIK